MSNHYQQCYSPCGCHQQINSQDLQSLRFRVERLESQVRSSHDSTLNALLDVMKLERQMDSTNDRTQEILLRLSRLESKLDTERFNITEDLKAYLDKLVKEAEFSSDTDSERISHCIISSR